MDKSIPCLPIKSYEFRLISPHIHERSIKVSYEDTLKMENYPRRPNELVKLRRFQEIRY